MNIQILETLTGIRILNPSDVIEQGFIGSAAESAGCWIKTKSVNNICPCTVIAVEKEVFSDSWCITAEVNYKQWVRYCHLDSVKVSVSDELVEGQLVGTAYRGSTRFDYCTDNKNNLPVRVDCRQLYKTDPTPVLFGQEKLSKVL